VRPTDPLENLNREELIRTARRLLTEADSLSSRISAVNEIGVAVNETLDLDKILRVVARQAKWLLDFEHCSVCVGQAESWRLVTLFGGEEAQPKDWLATENVGAVLKSAQPKLFHEGNSSPFLARFPSQIIIPLCADDTVLGTINFAVTRPKGYTHDDMRIAYMLSLQLSSAIRNARVVEELRRIQNELRLRVEELDAYGHTIAHDLKAPLSSIMLAGDLLALKFSDDLQPDGQKFVRMVGESARHMQRMIDQLLWLARVRHVDNVKVIPLRPVAEAALSRFRPTIEERGITVCLPSDLPDVVGHEQWIEEIFANLVSNAIKYMGETNPDPRIEIRARVEDTRVRCEVRDTGVGIKPEDQARLFEMFTRLHTVRAEGLGLGLSIVRRMIAQLGGQVGVESVYGQGSTFWFTLPKGVSDAPAAGDSH
jgi:signal transduction histidine kinase